MSGPDPRELNELLDKLEPAIHLLRRSWASSGLASMQPSVVLAGTRAGILRVAPEHLGQSPYAVAMAPRQDTAARLRALDEPEAADMVGLGATSGAESFDVVVVTDAWVAVVDLVPAHTTAPGGAA